MIYIKYSASDSSRLKNLDIFAGMNSLSMLKNIHLSLLFYQLIINGTDTGEKCIHFKAGNYNRH